MGNASWKWVIPGRNVYEEVTGIFWADKEDTVLLESVEWQLIAGPEHVEDPKPDKEG